MSSGSAKINTHTIDTRKHKIYNSLAVVYLWFYAIRCSVLGAEQ